MEPQKMPKQSVAEALGDMLTEFIALPAGANPEFAWTGLRSNSINEFRILHAILQSWIRNEYCSVSTISLATGISKATVSRTVTDLIGHGFLTEVEDDDDGRRRVLVPTEKSQTLVNQVKDWIVRWADRLRTCP